MPLLTSTWFIKSDLSVRPFVTLICPMVSALLFASRYTSQKSKLKIKGSKNNPHFSASRGSIRAKPGPCFWTPKTQKYLYMLFAKWFKIIQVPSYSLRKMQHKPVCLLAIPKPRLGKVRLGRVRLGKVR